MTSKSNQSLSSDYNDNQKEDKTASPLKNLNNEFNIKANEVISANDSSIPINQKTETSLEQNKNESEAVESIPTESLQDNIMSNIPNPPIKRYYRLDLADASESETDSKEMDDNDDLKAADKE